MSRLGPQAKLPLHEPIRPVAERTVKPELANVLVFEKQEIEERRQSLGRVAAVKPKVLAHETLIAIEALDLYRLSQNDVHSSAIGSPSLPECFPP